MNRIALLLLCFFSTPLFSQEKELLGEWILVRTLKLDNSRLEINSPYYSNYGSIEIKKNEYIVLGQSFSTKFKKNTMEMPIRTIQYQLKEGYLVTEEDGLDRRNFYLKRDDFVSKFPEFTMGTIERNGKTLYVDNKINAYAFEKVEGLRGFINDNQKDNDRDSKTFENLYFKIEFVLTTDNKIKYIKVLNSIDNRHDNDFIFSLMKAEPFLINLTDKDVLITLDNEYLKWTKDLKDKEEKKLHDLHYKGNIAYRNNKFDEAIKYLAPINDLKIGENRFNSLVENANLYLGVSYLVMGDQLKACESFRRVGDLTNFTVRNYLLDFCQD